MPIINNSNEYSSLPLPLNAVHAVSLHNLATNYEYDQKSPTLSASFVLDQNPIMSSSLTQASFNRSASLINAIPCSSQYNRMRSSSEVLSRGFRRHTSVPNDEIDQVNIGEIGWKIPPNPVERRNSQQKLFKMQSENSFSALSLNAIKDAVPVHSQSTHSLVQRRSFDEQSYLNAVGQPIIQLPKPVFNRKSIRNAFMKSRSFNSFENQSHSSDYQSDGVVIDVPRKSVQKTKRNLLKIPPNASNRSLLSLNIVKSFNDAELRAVCSTTAISDVGVREIYDTSDDNPPQKQRLYKKNVKSGSRRKLPIPLARSTQAVNQVRQIDTNQQKTNIKTEPSAFKPIAQIVPQSKQEIEVKIPSRPIKQESSEFESNHSNNEQRYYTDSMQYDNDKVDHRQKIKRFRKLSHRNSARRSKSKESIVQGADSDRQPNFQNSFKKITSFSSEDDPELVEIVKNAKTEKPANDFGSDDVFEPPNPKPLTSRRFSTRRSSSLEDLNLYQAKKLLEKKLESSGRSTVSINETPEYFEYDNKVLPKKRGPNACSSGSFPSIANRNLNFPKNQPNGVDCLQMSPKRGLLKKPSSSSATQNDQNDVNAPNSSEYDVRDRHGNTANSNNRSGAGQPSLSGISSNRDTYRDRSGEREPSRSLSDRDPREHDDSFNRSMSNAEGTPEDKIGMCFVIYFMPSVDFSD